MRVGQAWKQYILVYMTYVRSISDGCHEKLKYLWVSLRHVRSKQRTGWSRVPSRFGANWGHARSMLVQVEQETFLSIVAGAGQEQKRRGWRKKMKIQEYIFVIVVNQHQVQGSTNEKMAIVFQGLCLFCYVVFRATPAHLVLFRLQIQVLKRKKKHCSLQLQSIIFSGVTYPDKQ